LQGQYQAPGIQRLNDEQYQLNDFVASAYQNPQVPAYQLQGPQNPMTYQNPQVPQLSYQNPQVPTYSLPQVPQLEGYSIPQNPAYQNPQVPSYQMNPQVPAYQLQNPQLSAYQNPLSYLDEDTLSDDVIMARQNSNIQSKIQQHG